MLKKHPNFHYLISIIIWKYLTYLPVAIILQTTYVITLIGVDEVLPLRAGTISSNESLPLLKYNKLF